MRATREAGAIGYVRVAFSEEDRDRLSPRNTMLGPHATSDAMGHGKPEVELHPGPEGTRAEARTDGWTTSVDLFPGSSEHQRIERSCER